MEKQSDKICWIKPKPLNIVIFHNEETTNKVIWRQKAILIILHAPPKQQMTH